MHTSKRKRKIADERRVFNEEWTTDKQICLFRYRE